MNDWGGTQEFMFKEMELVTALSKLLVLKKTNLEGKEKITNRSSKIDMHKTNVQLSKNMCTIAVY